MSPRGPFALEHSQGSAHAADVLALRAEAFAAPACADTAREWDALDALSHHVLARDGEGRLLGAGRLSPDQRIARLGVLPAWRGRGIGRALLGALLQEAHQRDWPQLRLQLPAPSGAVSGLPFFVPAGFLPLRGSTDLQRRLDGPMAVEDAAAATLAAAAVIAQSRRELRIYSRALDPGLLDARAVQAALRAFATLPHDKQVRVLVQEAGNPQLFDAPLLRLAQRLPSVFQFRAVCDPVDASYAAAYLVGDAQSYYFRSTGSRYDDGETWLEGAARARQLRAHFEQIWERSRLWHEHRALGL
ncbi:MAG TPA: GNAT family N-acetyltransferase [Stenotrophomonas sp.]|nr:GNAT family N-acetyltransferase [Stenotrophomonas sp.]